MADDDKWKARFQAFAMIRLFGLATFLFGVFAALTDLVRDGGWPLLGGVLAIVGALDAVLAPRLLKAHWEREDRGA